MGTDQDGSTGCVVLCAGSDCAKDERRAFRKLREAVRQSGLDVVPSRCLGVCNGPVVVVDPVGERPVVLRRVRRGAARRAVIDLARSKRSAVRSDDALAVGGKKARRAIRRAVEAV
ncbi:MAG: hypothetical protein AAGA17_06420 [Actinomycetota bacterium]